MALIINPNVGLGSTHRKPCLHAWAEQINKFASNRKYFGLTTRADYSTHPNLGNGDSKSIVDANMKVLKRRLQDMKRQEMQCKAMELGRSMQDLRRRRSKVDQQRVSNVELAMAANKEKWMKWEKDYHAFLQEEISCILAFLHHFLLHSRPSVSLSLLLCVTLSLPIAGILTLSTIASWLLTLLLSLQHIPSHLLYHAYALLVNTRL